MKISLVAVGTKMPAWVQSAYGEYEKRLPRELKPQLIEIALAPRNKNSKVEALKKIEGEQVLAAIPKPSRVIALDLAGKRLSTESLTSQIEHWQMAAENIALMIGGPDGLSAQCLQTASERWSLSDLTLPHPLVRIVLIEQLYRAWSILQNHPYHK